MKSRIIEKFRGGFSTGVGIAAGIFTSGLLAVTVSGAWHAFASGEILTAQNLNENFNSLKTAVEGVKETPAGLISAWAGGTPPAGWLECDGSAVSRTTYADLFTVLGTTYGSGDGSTTFNLPDYRGYFLRGWDHGAGRDVDSGGRTDRGDGATGDNVGTVQLHALEAHLHGLKYGGSGKTGVYSEGGITGLTYPIDSTYGANVSLNETRPKNVNVTYIIRY